MGYRKNVLWFALAACEIAGCHSSPELAGLQAGRGASTVERGGSRLGFQAGELVRGNKPADSTPDLSDVEYASFVSHVNRFGLDLGRSMVESQGLARENVVFSPLSATLALGMTYAGARGQTAQELKVALGDTFEGETFHAACNRAMRELTMHVQNSASNQGSQRIDVAIANSQFVARDLPLEDAFLDLLAAQYDSGVRRMDFRADASKARADINRWVLERTHGTIVDLLPMDAVHADTKLVLVNALYFYGSWLQPFTHGNWESIFTDLNGSAQRVPKMGGRRTVLHLETDELAVAELPYMDGKLRMTIVLPKEGSFEAVRFRASAQWLDDLSSQLALRDVDMELPKFRFNRGTFSLRSALETLGVKSMFGSADFTGITPVPLAVSDVLQQAFVSVDEDGTEAAAATAIVFAGGGALIMPPATPFIVNRPFLFFIRDEHGAILFAGHVVDPRVAQ